MIERRDGIEDLGFPRGPSGIVDNPLPSRRRGKTLGWQAVTLRNVMQTISRGINGEQAAGGESGNRASQRYEEPDRHCLSGSFKLKEAAASHRSQTEQLLLGLQSNIVLNYSDGCLFRLWA